MILGSRERPTFGNANYAWACFYRVGEWGVGDHPGFNRWLTASLSVIVHNNRSHPQKTYQLSGVGVMDYLVRDVEVPSDRNMRRRRFRQYSTYKYQQLKDTLYIRPGDLRGRQNDNEPVYGFRIHANCWTLVERVIGPLAEQHLDILLEEMLSAWNQGGKKPQALYRRRLNCDPLHIPDIKELVKKLIRRGAVNTRPKSLAAATLPLEIMYMIFDRLGHDELELVLEATGWSVSYEYLRSRFRYHSLVFETEKLHSRVDLDWLFFYKEVEEVLEMSDGFKTRCNIIERLGGTRKRFLSRLALEMRHKVG